jgi:hypothetical protein
MSSTGRGAGVLAAAVVVAAGWLGYHVLTTPSKPSGPPCHATVGTATFGLDADQALNASVIAAVGAKLGLPDHAITVALATALQESGLRNLPGGDRDSLGLFQQRPSQGWGTPAQIMSPRYAAAAFYQRLVQLPAWQTLSVTVVAQAVQHSANPDGYAQWDPQARVLAQALTGEAPAAFSCRATVHAADVVPAAMNDELIADLGSGRTDAAVSAPRGWLISSWCIAHAERYGISTVTFGGFRWSATSGKWRARAPSLSVVQLNG